MEKPKREHKQKTMNYLITSIFVLVGLLVSVGLIFATYRAVNNESDKPLGQVAGEQDGHKWHPGHYLTYESHDSNLISRLQDLSLDKYDNIQGAKIKIRWDDLEEDNGANTFGVIDEYLNALPEDKYLFLLILDRDFQTSCPSAHIPNYVKNHSQYPAVSFNDGKGCVPQVWEGVINGFLIDLYQDIGTEYDSHPQFEGIITEETSLSIDEGSFSTYDLFIQIKRLNNEAKPFFPHTHLFQNMNWLGGGSHRCDTLRQLADNLEIIGGGITNPDTVPWRAKPFDGDDCTTFFYKPPDIGWPDLPIYHIYRDYKTILPVAVGNDTSQLRDPDNPEDFLSKPMTMPNLVDAIFQMATDGFWEDGDFVEGFGANYILWNYNFWSKEAGSVPGWEDAVLNFVNQPGHELDSTCPSSISCDGSLPSTPTPTITPGDPTLTPTNVPTPAPGSVITNISVSSGEPYQAQTNLQAGDTVYIDRNFVYNVSLPSYLLGANYIQTANDDKTATGEPFLSFDLTQDATVYIAHDARITSKPAWLTAFANTGETISVDGVEHSLYSQNYVQGIIVLGDNGVQNTETDMYVVIVVPGGSSSTPGDTNSDGDVDIFDYNTLLTQFGQIGDGLSADFDIDGDVDIFDYNTLLTNFGV